MIQDLVQRDDWRKADRAQQTHHFACQQCIGAGKGYGVRCDTGKRLVAAVDRVIGVLS